MRLKPGQRYSCSQYGNTHLVHREEPELFWCGRPATNYAELPNFKIEPSTRKDGLCPSCKEAENKFLDQKRLINEMQVASRGARW